MHTMRRQEVIEFSKILPPPSKFLQKNDVSGRCMLDDTTHQAPMAHQPGRVQTVSAKQGKDIPRTRLEATSKRRWQSLGAQRNRLGKRRLCTRR